jgi:pentatricopeptide repeat protein
VLLKENIKLNMKTRHILWGMICIVLFTDCSPTRNTPATRAYHELTTRYNIYFNAEETYYEILKERSDAFRDDYAELLPFYPSIPAAERPFEPVIDKTGKAILEHSITVKPRRDPAKAHSQGYRQWLRQEEFNPFLKNVWLLRGKACLQNGDYDEALSVFSGMLRLFDHDPALITETEIWMLRTYTEAGRIYEAEKTARTLRNRKLPKHLEKLFTEHYTYLLIRKKDFAAAIPLLPGIIAQEPGHLRKKRLQFLLGQLYATTGEKQKAYRAFEEVKGLRTPFELALNATVWQSAVATEEQQQKIVRRLKKMEQKINNTDSAAFSDQRRRICLNANNGFPVQAFSPPQIEIDEKNGQDQEKIVSLETPPSTTPERETPETLQRRLEENAAKALQQQPETTSRKSREQELREKKRQREEKVRQRKQELKERQRRREAELKQRERERQQKIRKQQ